MDTKVEVIYRLDNINPEQGVDVFEVSPVLMSFGELIRSASEALGYGKKIDIRVKPFKEGSWISQFIIEQTTVQSTISFFKSDSGFSLLVLLQLLGINAKDGTISVINLIRFTKGKIQNYKEEKERGVFVYTNEEGEKIEVSAPVHQLTHSPFVQMNYYNITAGALDKFPMAESISLQAVGEEKIEKITEEDKVFIEEYAKQELLTEIQSTEVKGVYIYPKRGSYSGEQKAYSFVLGDSVIWPTSIEDEEFLQKLLSGEIRLYQQDLLKVDLEIKQKRDAGNKVINQYAIKKVYEYIPFKKPSQGSLV